MTEVPRFAWRGRWHCGPVAYLLLYCLATAVLFQRPLYVLALSRLQVLDPGATLAVMTLFVLQFVLTLICLCALALVSMAAVRAACILLLFGNAVALYFIDSYGVVIDKAMMGNVVGTSWSEASAFVHPRLLLYVVFLAVVPSVAILRTRVATNRRRVAVAMLLACVLGAGWLYANARSWLWLDRNFRELGGLMLPWSYLVNTVRFQQERAAASRPEILLPPAHVTDASAVVVVLVIGESARARNFSLYGYPRPTNPLLAKAGVDVLQHTRSCATYTTRAVRCLLSHQGSHAWAAALFEPLPSYVQRHGVDVLWRSNNFGEPPMKVASFEKAPELASRCQGEDCLRVDSDEVLLQGLEARLRGPGPAKRLIVLHQSGSHGPLYSSRYPKRFEVFRPACRTVDLGKCGPGELVNAYDNTIVFTDYLLDRVITMLKALGDQQAVMVYVSDHGESLGEHGLYLHGTPYLMAPDVQTQVPFIVWASDSFRRRRNLVGQKIGGSGEHSQDLVFHSVLGALGLESAAYRRELDIFASRHTRP